MIKGIGIDIVELERIRNLIERQPKFAMRILTEKERNTFNELQGRRQVEFLAGRFAAKEAFAKASGTGIGKALSFLDIEVETDDLGKPFIKKISAAESIRTHLSISHSDQYAVAQVVIEEGH
jgi:holo-[acyl-carrier protein] synthase